MHQRHIQTGQTNRQDNGPIVHGEPFYKLGSGAGKFLQLVSIEEVLYKMHDNQRKSNHTPYRCCRLPIFTLRVQIDTSSSESINRSLF